MLKFDNNDKRIPYYELFLEKDLDEVLQYALPDGFHFEFYKRGDKDVWIEIEQSAKEFDSYEQGLDAWERYYAKRENELENRMVFIVNDNGEKVATATAFYDITNKDKSASGWLHWVAVKRDYQCKRLSKPLISYVLRLSQTLGYTHIKIPTQTTTWLAVKIYLDFGFMPVSQNAVSSFNGWCIIKALTNHKSLDEFDAEKGINILINGE